MTNQPADWVEPGDPVEAKPATNRTLQLVIGLLAFAGAALAFYFLFFQGGVLLVIGMLFELISLVGAPAGGKGDGDGALLMLPAIMVVSGLFLAYGLLDIAIRAATGKPMPGGSAIVRFCLIALMIVVATAIAIGVFTRGMGG